jgi:hypothetical protein
MDVFNTATIINYISNKKYSGGLSKNAKRRLREKSESFAVRDGELWHKSGKSQRLQKVIEDPAEQQRLIASLHSDVVGGGHFGVCATQDKLADR